MSDDDSAEKRPGTIQSVGIAMRFLRILANARSSLSLGTLARESGTGSSTAHRYIQSLVLDGYAIQDKASGYYTLGPAALELGAAALKKIDPIEIAADEMRQLAGTIAASAGIAVWTARGPTLVRWYRSDLFSISSLNLGDILPLDNSATGHVFQAYLPEKTVQAAREFQAAFFTQERLPAEALDRIRKTGRAELTSHLVEGITGQAAPIMNAQGDLVAAMLTVTNLGQMTVPADALALFEAARRVQNRTGLSNS